MLTRLAQSPHYHPCYIPQDFGESRGKLQVDPQTHTARVTPHSIALPSRSTHRGQTCADPGLHLPELPAKPNTCADMLRFQPELHQAVIFDCDGTLVDSMPLHHEAWRRALRTFDAPFEFDWHLFQSRAGMTIEQTVEALNDQFSCHLDPNAVALAQRTSYDAIRDQVLTIPHVVQFAGTLRGSVPLAVASASRAESVKHALGRVGLMDWFDVVVTANDVSRGKPAPDLFLLAARKLEIAPERCLVVEDGLLGIEGAHRAGMDAFFITREGASDFRPCPR